MIQCEEKFCVYKTKSWVKMQQHMRDKHEGKKYPCYDCGGRLFKNIKKHRKDIHSGLEFKCSFCLEKFETSDKVTPHILAKHPEFIATTKEKDDSEEPEDMTLHDKMDSILDIEDERSVLIRGDYAINYDHLNKRPNFTLEKLTTKSCQNRVGKEEAPPFLEDPDLGDGQASPEAIHKEKFDCGHLAAKRNHLTSMLSVMATFWMCNIAAQNPSLNTGRWSALERFIIEHLVPKWKKVTVLTGVVYGSTPKISLGGVKVWIPSHFYKLVLLERKWKVPVIQVYIFENKRDPSSTCFFDGRATLKDLRKLTGLNFLRYTKCKHSWEGARPNFYTCDNCNGYFREEEKLENHQCRKRTIVEKEEVKESTTPTVNDAEQREIKCTNRRCNYKCNTVIGMQIHHRHAHKSRAHPCYLGNCGGRVMRYVNPHVMFNHITRSKKCPFCPSTCKAVLPHILKQHRISCSLYEPQPPAIDQITESEDVVVDLRKKLQSICNIQNNDSILSRGGFIVYYDHEKKRPDLTFELVTKSKCRKVISSRTVLLFKEDPELGGGQATPEAIHETNFQCGHLAARANNCSSFALFKATYLMCNIVAQSGYLNCSIWAGLETFIRSHLVPRWDKVFVVTGVVYDSVPRISSEGGTFWVPTHFYKIIVLERKGEETEVQAYIVENKDDRTTQTFFDSKATVQQVEELTGLQFLRNMNYHHCWDVGSKTTAHVCTKCHITYREKERLDAHTCFPCHNCTQVFDTNDALKQHLEDVHELTCKVCSVLRPRSAELRRHMALKHGGEKLFKCDICPKSYTQYYHLKMHKRIHANNRPHMCTVCGMGFNYSKVLQSHMQTHVPTPILVCDVCHKRFTSKMKLDRHTTRLHSGGVQIKDPSTIDMSKPYPCRICHQRYGTKKIRRIHMKSHANKRHYECEVCGMSFNTFPALYSHRSTHSDEKPYVCYVCATAFKLRFNLLNHVRTQHPNIEYVMPPSKRKPAAEPAPKPEISFKHPYVCYVCSGGFMTRDYLSKHASKMHPTIKYEMPPSKNSAAARLLNIKQSGNQPYVCYVCKKAYSARSTLVKHVKKLHPTINYKMPPKKNSAATRALNSRKSDKSEYVCYVCEADFTTKGSLFRHAKVKHPTIKYKMPPRKGANESEEKPYKCDICSSGFTLRESLIRHARVLHPGINFKLPPRKERSSLITFRITNSNEYPYMCYICGLGFKLRDSLARHAKTKHIGINFKMPPVLKGSPPSPTSNDGQEKTTDNTTAATTND